jgi:hypothetical protein
MHLFFTLQTLTLAPDISDDEYQISIALDVTNTERGDETEPPTFLLHVKYPESYPDEAPILDLRSQPGEATHPLFDISTDKDTLLANLAETIEENLGMAMIFTLVSTLKESAELLIAERQEVLRQEQEAVALAAEAEENKKFTGTPVNPDTFAEWRVAFRREMEEVKRRQEEDEEAAEKKKNRGKETEVRLTGRQLWERGLAGKVEEEEWEEGEEDALPEGVQKLTVAA